MTHLIDKDALVAEIERLDALYHTSKDLSGDLFIQGLFCFIDSIKVKEVDIENVAITEWNDYIKKIDGEPDYAYMLIKREDYIALVKHFFELALQAEPSEIKSKCMYTNDNFTDEDRKVLCDGCEEDCKYNKKEPVNDKLGGINNALVQDRLITSKPIGIPADAIELVSIPEKKEPVSEDLEQAIDNYLATYFGGEKEKQDWPFLKKTVIHFAKWQKEQMMKNAIDGDITFDYYGDDNKTYACMAHESFCLEERGLKDRDKVKVIIIKA